MPPRSKFVVQFKKHFVRKEKDFMGRFVHTCVCQNAPEKVCHCSMAQWDIWCHLLSIEWPIRLRRHPKADLRSNSNGRSVTESLLSIQLRSNLECGTGIPHTHPIGIAKGRDAEKRSLFISHFGALLSLQVELAIKWDDDDDDDDYDDFSDVFLVAHGSRDSICKPYS